MNTRHWLMLTAAAAILTSTFYTAVTAQSGMTQRATTVAVVDIQRVFNASEQKGDIDANMTQKGAALREEAQGYQERIAGMRNQLDLYEVGSENHRSRVQEIQQAQFEAESWLKWEQAKLQMEQARFIKTLYNEAIDAIEDVSEANGIDMVFFRDGQLPDGFESPQQASAQIQQRKLIWASNDVDITDAVISRMNLNYQAR
ncbi:OmpH family outer membrane protein [Mucisphaera sp.]|uniref:OmpH family outer membrane protein n=1 Tax=Mucisphaera sp. TaxID=2913024 RepID=UPI003D0CFDA7